MKGTLSSISGNVFLTLIPERVSELRSGMSVFSDPEGIAMLFPARPGSVFWMKGCRFGLDMVFLDSAGRIIDIVSLPPEKPGEEIPRAEAPNGSSLMMELPSGSSRKMGLRAGMNILGKAPAQAQNDPEPVLA